MRLGRIFSNPIGAAVAGFAGAHLLSGILGRGGERGAGQEAAYNNQLGQIRAEQQRMNERVEASRNSVNRGVARGNRARARGGIFGDAGAPAAPVSARLG